MRCVAMTPRVSWQPFTPLFPWQLVWEVRVFALLPLCQLLLLLKHHVTAVPPPGLAALTLQKDRPGGADGGV